MELIGRPVESLQWMLRAIAFAVPGIPFVIPDGIYGQQTMAAVSAFQREYNLPITGVTDYATWREISAAYQAVQISQAPWEPIRLAIPVGSSLQVGDAPACTYLVQAIFLILSKQFSDVPPVSVCGQYDEATAEAVRWLQELAGLPVTGELDADSWRFLSRMACIRSESVTNPDTTPESDSG